MNSQATENVDRPCRRCGSQLPTIKILTRLQSCGGIAHHGLLGAIISKALLVSFHESSPLFHESFHCCYFRPSFHNYPTCYWPYASSKEGTGRGRVLFQEPLKSRNAYRG
uniref:Uncharacterized protein n=1 Tax=Cannabis sativa TaxID=3483 RepID=A0A803QS33_CANSA